MKLIDSFGKVRQSKDEKNTTLVTIGALLDDKKARESFSLTLAKLRETATGGSAVKILDSPAAHRKTGLTSSQHSSSKIKTLEAFLTSRRNSSRERGGNGNANVDKTQPGECPTAKRRLYIKDKPESPQSEVIESPDLASGRDPDSYSNRQLA